MTSEQDRTLTADEAVALLRQHAFTEEADERTYEPVQVGDETLYRDVTSPPRQRIHTFRSFIGCDWDLDDAEQAVREAKTITWAEHFARHNLAVVESDGGCVWFDVPAPAGDAS